MLQVASFIVFVSRPCFKKIVPIGTVSGTNGRKGERCWRWLPLHCFRLQSLLQKDSSDRYRLWDEWKEWRKVLDVAIPLHCFRLQSLLQKDSIQTLGLMEGRKVLQMATSLAAFVSRASCSKRYPRSVQTLGRKEGWQEGGKVLQVATSLTGESTVRVGIIHLLQQQATACCAGCYLTDEHAHTFQFTCSTPQQQRAQRQN